MSDQFEAAELLFIEVLRKHIGQLPEDSRGWLSGLRDRHVGAALRLIHGRPAQDWTLEALAREVGLSRSAFAERFNAYVGAPPIEYLGRWRMQLAARLLDQGSSIADVAAQVGYDSEVTFNRVFKRFVVFRRVPGARLIQDKLSKRWTAGGRSQIVEFHSRQAPLQFSKQHQFSTWAKREWRPRAIGPR